MGGAELRDAGSVADAVQASGLVGAGGPVLVMCSAGRDSGCLLDLVVRLRGTAGVRVLHVDHGLRGAEESAADVAVVAGWCEAAGVELVVRRADASAAPGHHVAGNVHAWARAARQRLAAEVAAGAEAAAGPEVAAGARMLVAHTRTDLVETALARFATQPGRRALLSMRAVEGALARPLLAAGISREETAAYCRERGLAFRDDPSNSDRAYARARVRHDVLPVLRSLNPRAEEAVARTLTELADEAAVLDALVDAELAAVGPTAGGPAVALERLAVLPPALARLVLRELCEQSLQAPCPRAASRLDAVLALRGAAARTGRGSVDVGEGARVELRGGLLRCRRSEGPAAPQRP